MRARCCFLAPLLLALTSVSFAQQWFSVHTGHFISYSNGNDRGARDAALRGEQLITLFGHLFHRKDINFATPLRLRTIRAGEPLHGASNSPGLVRTPIANFVTVDLSQPDSWAQAAKSLAALTLEDNYPRAQPWFDSGIASYLAGVGFTGGQVELGGPPPGIVLPKSGEWIPLARLIEINELSQFPSAQRPTFEAESWALVRWLIDNSRLPQAGVYLNALHARGATPERALVEAFSMGSTDLDREVRESLGKLSLKKSPAPRIEENLLKSQKVAAADAYVLDASLSLFGPEPQRTLDALVAFMRQNPENAAAHRSLAWAFLLRNDPANAIEHIRRALALDDSDPSMHYLYARWVNQGEEDRIRVESAETSMGSELKAALKRDPSYAPALELLGLAQLSDDAVQPALRNLQRASALRPRSGRYYLNLARAYEAAGNLDAARNLILYARTGGDAALSREAGGLLDELSKQKKKQRKWEAMGLHPDPNTKHSKYENLPEAIAADEKAEAKSKSPEPPSPEPPKDTRKIEYLKGRIVVIECASAPGAILTVISAGSTWHIHVADRNAIVLIGVDHFDCGWHDAAASINYKRSGKNQGDMISLEMDR